MEEGKVSIVLPVFNGADYIAESIESIIAQSYQYWELIIVNDCSTDSTLEICKGFSDRDERIIVISNEENKKLPNTLNVGFDRATGEYYTWTSDDNLFKPDAIETLVKTLKQNPDAVMVYSDYTNIDIDGKIIGKGKLPEPKYIVTCNVCGACFLYTADVARKVGRYDANLFLAEDYDYWMRIYRYGKMIHIVDDLYLYRRHSGSLTETKKAFVNEQTYKALEKNFLPLYLDAKRNKLNNYFFDHILRRGAYKEEIKRMLFLVDKKYRNYLNVNNLKRRIRGTAVYKVFRRT